MHWSNCSALLVSIRSWQSTTRKTQSLLIQCLQRKKQKEITCLTLHMRVWRLQVISRKASALVSHLLMSCSQARPQAHGDLENCVFMQTDGYQVRGAARFGSGLAPHICSRPSKFLRVAWTLTQSCSSR